MAAALAVTFVTTHVNASRVTIITHGYNASVDEWIIPMARRMAGYTVFWGTDASCYQITVSTNISGAFQVTSQFLEGSTADKSESGNILIKLDWSNVAGEFVGIFDFYPSPFDVTRIAQAIAPAFSDPNLIPDLGGHALAEFSMHMIGHSRGGPLITEIARFLGENGIWVDQITTLDPHPCDPNDFLEGIGCPVNDVDALIYENVFFADNYWQNQATPMGQFVNGAYNRQLTALPFGYGSPHSNTHLWYHGTIDFTSPVTTDSIAELTDTDRLVWFAGGETNGMWSGFLNSPIGGGDRFSVEQPAGPGTPQVIEGVTGARFALPANDGTWPNIITFNAANDGRFEFNSEPGLALREENVVYPDATLTVAADYQSGQDANLIFFLDPDANSLNGNEIELAQDAWSATGISSVSNIVRSLVVDSQFITNGIYFLGSRITAITSGAARTTYAPQKIAVLEPLRLTLRSTSLSTSELTVTGSAGYQALIETSGTFSNWNNIITNTFFGGAIGEAVTVPNQVSLETINEFYRASYLRIDEE